jgi:hypothetical protein
MRLHPLRKDFLRAGVASGCMVAVLLFIPTAGGLPLLVAKVATGGALYLAAAWVLNVAGIRSWLSARQVPTR